MNYVRLIVFGVMPKFSDHFQNLQSAVWCVRQRLVVVKLEVVLHLQREAGSFDATAGPELEK
jgi:hypothetical protein